MTREHFTFANDERERDELAAHGWRASPVRPPASIGFYMKWFGSGEPPPATQGGTA